MLEFYSIVFATLVLAFGTVRKLVLDSIAVLLCLLMVTQSLFLAMLIYIKLVSITLLVLELYTVSSLAPVIWFSNVVLLSCTPLYVNIVTIVAVIFIVVAPSVYSLIAISALMNVILLSTSPDPFVYFFVYALYSVYVLSYHVSMVSLASILGIPPLALSYKYVLLAGQPTVLYIVIVIVSLLLLAYLYTTSFSSTSIAYTSSWHSGHTVILVLSTVISNTLML